ncbi:MULTISPECIES: hypothetical protein [Flammeovirga]|uniref:STAS domain-containing protein n=1 Tax=Flammeovirga agarivorans TaxID=2726742 RepID=A0A7X8SPK9_9BACT|nr:MULTISPECIES: hypothetical protein [Flammeovirga]NLR93970.1 hypothetical protein [Flammeovirga agarivorans]
MKIKLQGKIDNEQLELALIEFAKSITEEKQICVVDGKELENQLDLSAKYSIITALDSFGFQRGNVFYVAANSPRDQLDIIENIAFNRGWRLYCFTTLEETLAAAEEMYLKLNGSKVI